MAATATGFLRRENRAKIRGVLDGLTLAEPALTLAEIHSRTGLPTSTVHRLAAYLADLPERFLVCRR
ncbi:helix-turn-helix domain-containing protein [Mycobacterium marinum]|uniref:helix-turn-helix domain-containing protein n=1 Tax=Mycobacterium marinum TaxID=1781 RepID=UPI0035618F9E